MDARKILYGYVDETGDRGVSAKSSRFFAMSGLIMPAEVEPAMREAIGRCRARFGVPSGKPLHFKEHVKTYSRRQYVASELAAVPEACVNYVIIEKAAIPSTAGMYNDHTIFYNYVAGLMMERLLFAAADWPGGPRDLLVRFGHVRGFKHEETLTYLQKKQQYARGVPWQLLRRVKFAGTSEYDGLQAADQYGGLLRIAIVPDEYGGYEEHHFLKIAHQIRRYRGTAWGAGFKVMALPGTMERLPWWRHARLGKE